MTKGRLSTERLGRMHDVHGSRFGWDGCFGTSWASDPSGDMVAILMTQCAGFPTTSRAYLDFWTGAYQAIDD